MRKIKKNILTSLFLSFILVFIIGVHNALAQKKVSPEVALPESGDFLFETKNIEIFEKNTSFSIANVFKKTTAKNNTSPEVALPESGDFLFETKNIEIFEKNTSFSIANVFKKTTAKNNTSPEVALPESGDFLSI